MWYRLAPRAASADTPGMPPAATAPSLLSGPLARLLRRGEVRALYQPIVDLDDGTPVAYEALARGPQGSPLESPLDLFAAARDHGLVAELDRACRRAAIAGAHAAGLRTPQTLFVNIEPATITGLDALLGLADDLRDDLQVVVELTERALTDRPAEVLAAVAALRAHGCGIALDDVGVDQRSLALMPFVAPDVIKLDMSLIQQRGASPSAARVLNAVAAEVERSGAVLLAEGIETEEHLARARAVGATLGQGWLFGRPGALPSGRPPAIAADRIPLLTRDPLPPGTPFELIADMRRVRRGDKRLLLALSRQLEAEASLLGGEAVVLSNFQDVNFFTPRSRDAYEALARSAALVGALGVGLGEEPAAGVRGAGLHEDDELVGEWDVAVVGPHFAGAMVARDLGDIGPDGDRRFDFFVTYERELVVRAARALMARIVPTVGS
jgi:EAL domain-containing protein (putative c-di-GMP-specific phosphodiesterase class I)